MPAMLPTLQLPWWFGLVWELNPWPLQRVNGKPLQAAANAHARGPGPAMELDLSFGASLLRRLPKKHQRRAHFWCPLHILEERSAL